MGILGRGSSFSPWSVLWLQPSLFIDNMSFIHQWSFGHWAPNGPCLLFLWVKIAQKSWCLPTWDIREPRCLFWRYQHQKRETKVWRLHVPVQSLWPPSLLKRVVVCHETDTQRAADKHMAWKEVRDQPSSFPNIIATVQPRQKGRALRVKEIEWPAVCACMLSRSVTSDSLRLHEL